MLHILAKEYFINQLVHRLLDRGGLVTREGEHEFEVEVADHFAAQSRGSAKAGRVSSTRHLIELCSRERGAPEAGAGGEC